MKKINKLFLAAGSMAAVVAPIAATVSCGTEGSYEWSKVSGSYSVNGNAAVAVPTGFPASGTTKISYITDGGSIDDKSFNEGALNGVKNYSQEAGATFTYKVVNTDKTKTTTAFATAYNSADSDQIVVAGFAHQNPGANGDILKFSHDNPNKKIVAIDIADTSSDASTNNLFGITFKTQQAGFMAAVDAGYMLNKHFEHETSKEAMKVATFGGAQYPTVTSYMIGFRQGVAWFNKQAAQQKLRELELVKAGSDFTGSFDPGMGRALADKLLDKGARAIFGVAGPQTNDICAAIKTKRLQGKAFAIGIDVDQSQSYGGTVLVSAVKGLTAVAKKTLEEINKTNGATTEPADKEYTIKDGQEFVGAVMNAIGYKAEADAAEAHKAEAETAAAAEVYATNW